MMSFFRYAMLAVAVVLVFIVTFLLLRYRKVIEKKGHRMSREDVIGRFFLRKLKKISSEKGKEKNDELFRRLNRTMRAFFRELFDIKYEFSYLELNEELAKKDLSDDTRKEIVDYNMKLSEAGYGSPNITEKDFFVMLEKSIRIVRKLTGYKEDMDFPEMKPGTKGIPSKKKEDISMPRDEKQKLSRISNLLVEAEESVSGKKYADAMESYRQLREIYDSLKPERKEKMKGETKRIIAVYNTLLENYKGDVKV